MGGRFGERRSSESSSEQSELSSFDEQYQEIALNCFRYLDFKSFEEVDRLTIPEYEMLIKAHRLKQVDIDARIHQLAFLCFAVKAERKSGKGGKPIFDKFYKFYDYKSELQKVEDEFKNLSNGDGGKKSRFSGIGKLLKKGE